jgi:hypothetical protein
MTFREFECALGWEIAGRYNQEIHSALLRPPRPLQRLLRDTAPVLTRALLARPPHIGVSWFSRQAPIVAASRGVRRTRWCTTTKRRTVYGAAPMRANLCRSEQANGNDIAEAKAALAQVAEAQKGDAVAFRVVSRPAEGGSERLQVAGARNAPGQNLDQPARGSSKVTCRRRVRGRLGGLFVSTHAHDRVGSFRALPRRHCPDAEVTR